ncbi:MAG: hypothetical protein ABSE89_03825 [Sedimentisphaerales bacterium]
MAKKLILFVLAGIMLLAVTDRTFGEPQNGGQQWDGWRWGGWHHFLPQIRPMAFAPQIGPMVEDRTVAVWITNNDGSKTEVKLIVASAGGWTGPKGEYYSSMPTDGQLKALYGLPCAAPVRNNVIVYLGNCNGAEIIVVLTKDGPDYVGPKGERYEGMPTEEQLRLVYCR